MRPFYGDLRSGFRAGSVSARWLRPGAGGKGLGSLFLAAKGFKRTKKIRVVNGGMKKTPDPLVLMSEPLLV
jgi:hypothetical protein